MSQFSEKLKRLVEDSGLTIYHLAKSAGLDRTTIQRSLSGERLPGPAFVESLCDYLQVSLREREELIQSYSICKIGEQVYKGRKYIEEIIAQIASLHIHRNAGVTPGKSVAPGTVLTHDVKIFEGQYNVNQLVRIILEEEVRNSAAPSVSLAIPFSFRYLFDCLKQLYWESDGKASIRHIVAFSKNPHAQRNPNANLEVLSDVLPFAFCMGSGYQPHYYYDAYPDAEYFTHAMPYYFFTSNCLVTVSTDFNTAVVYRQQEMICLYQQHFEACLAGTSPLVNQLSGLLDMIMVGFGEVIMDEQITHVLEPQPCFARYYDHAMVEEYMRPELPNRAEMKAHVCELYDCYKTFDRMQSFFTVEGLRQMAETGIMADLPQSFAAPFRVAERIRLMRLLRNDIQNDLYYARAIDSSKLEISHVATMQLYHNRSLMLMATTDRGMVTCMIREQSIFSAFLDFFESLPESGLLYSKEDTLKVIDSYITHLEAGRAPAEEIFADCSKVSDRHS